MISICIECKSCTFLVRGETPRVLSTEPNGGNNFDEAVRKASVHAEHTLHELQFSGRLTRTDAYL